MFRSFLRPIAALATLAGLAAYATIMLRGPQGLSALAEKRKQIRMLEEENANLARDVEEKKKFIERLKTDPESVAFSVVGAAIGAEPTGAPFVQPAAMLE